MSYEPMIRPEWYMVIISIVVAIIALGIMLYVVMFVVPPPPTPSPFKLVAPLHPLAVTHSS